MDFHRYMRAIRKSWWIIVLLMVVIGGLAYGYSKRQTPIYSSKLTFYVGSPALADSSANATNQFAQDRATSYAKLLSSDRLAQMITDAPGVGATTRQVAGEISATAQLNTVLIDVQIHDASPARALAIGRAVGLSFPQLVDELDNTPSRTAPATVKLSVVSGPTTPKAPISPRTRLNVLIGVALGLILGLALAALRELFDFSVRSAEALAQLSGIPVLGTIAFDRTVKTQPLIIDNLAYSPRAESMRQIRTNLQFMEAAAASQVLVITSSVEAEGKSITAANLALSLAETGKQVVLIEADMRRPRLSELMDVERSVGLSNVLARQVDLDDVLQKWGSEGLTILPSGTIPPNPAELLGGARMRELLTELRSRFDIALIDTPPVLPVTDSTVLAASADGTIVVFRAGKTRRWQLQAALESLTAVQATVLGCVLNMKPVSRRDASGYAGYYATAIGADQSGGAARGRRRLVGRLIPGVPKKSSTTNRPAASPATSAPTESPASNGRTKAEAQSAPSKVPAKAAAKSSAAKTQVSLAKQQEPRERTP
ncbi:MAG: capsular exopolysaccharide family [Jatrophihabitans sp.]|nr:capsular exopolysaccharide family [Jatrophihabitans sp.]